MATMIVSGLQLALGQYGELRSKPVNFGAKKLSKSIITQQSSRSDAREDHARRRVRSEALTMYDFNFRREINISYLRDKKPVVEPEYQRRSR
ncbi:hypothetical protein EVAR_66648_1 [Eumeta japonica]|uniref:Uncharacterized protein n=1 Tax=Eumeta variegata TaxID=151549 RepID=A0A4C1ZN74_EUMVA|nr:hypothetical protein EVAR_66648_1 [Eumeta japonica]